MNEQVSTSVEETIRIASEFAKQLEPGDVVCLEGELGSGKTHFVKGVAVHFGVPAEKVSSPTYTLIHEYEGVLPVYHFDCYRLKSEQEALEIGAEEYFYGEGVSLIEWPGKIEDLIPDEAIWIKISHLSGSKRSIMISSETQ